MIPKGITEGESKGAFVGAGGESSHSYPCWPSWGRREIVHLDHHPPEVTDRLEPMLAEELLGGSILLEDAMGKGHSRSYRRIEERAACPFLGPVKEDIPNPMIAVRRIQRTLNLDLHMRIGEIVDIGCADNSSLSIEDDPGVRL
ncbi:MAG TPA: hypothetical protein ENH11_03365 [Candidatus Acetothermia bacterium]|nr:hypothetical protein [Candidatus Acetothermia bacterium]